jgi:hypothetical protein
MDDIYKKLNSMDKKSIQQVYCKIKKVKKTSLDKAKIVNKLLKPLLKKYKMMGVLHRPNTFRDDRNRQERERKKYNDKESENEDDDYDEPFKEPIKPQILSSPWDIYVKNVGEVKYFVALSKPNKRDGYPISNIVVGIFYDGKIFLHKKYNACKYKGFSTVITPLTYPKTGVLVKNGFTYSGNFVKDRISSTFASLGYQNITKDMKMKYDLQDEISVKEFKNVVYALHNYIKTSMYATPLELCDINNSKNCLRKCGKFKHCDQDWDANTKKKPYFYTHEACFIYNWGTSPYTYELLLRKNSNSFVQVYPYEKESKISLKMLLLGLEPRNVGYSLKN